MFQITNQKGIVGKSWEVWDLKNTKKTMEKTWQKPLVASLGAPFVMNLFYICSDLFQPKVYETNHSNDQNWGVKSFSSPLTFSGTVHTMLRLFSTPPHLETSG